MPGSNIHVISTDTLVAHATRQVYDVIGTNTRLSFTDGGGNAVQVQGSHDVISLTNTTGMTIDDTGSAMRLMLHGSNSVTVTDFAHDPTGHITLGNSIYANAQDAVNHITSDGHGGSQLMLGSGGVIDFANTTGLKASAFTVLHV